MANMPAAPQSSRETVFSGLLICLFIVFSSSMIAFNKYLMVQSRFPYPVHLGFAQTLVGSCLIFIAYWLNPSLFRKGWRLSDCPLFFETKFLVTKFLPIAIVCTVTVLLGNTAYMYLPMGFLQMLKELNLCLLYGMAILVGLEKFDAVQGRVLLFVLFAGLLTIRGEMHLTLVGLVVAAASQVGQCMQLILEALLLTDVDSRVNALSYALVINPMCCGLLSCVLACSQMLGSVSSAGLGLTELYAWGPVLLVNGALAFALNMTSIMLIQRISAVSFHFVSLAKKAVVVLCGCLILGEHVSTLQLCGFALLIGGTLAWSVVKLFPEDFRGGLMRGLGRIASSASGRTPTGASTKEDGSVFPAKGAVISSMLHERLQGSAYGATGRGLCDGDHLLLSCGADGLPSCAEWHMILGEV